MTVVTCLDRPYVIIQRIASVQGFEGMLMDKINVNGKDASPVYNYLKVRLQRLQSENQHLQRWKRVQPTIL